MYVANWAFIIMIINLESEADATVVTAQDYTLLISDLPTKVKSYEKLRKKFLEVDNICPISLNPTFRLAKFMELKEEFNRMKKKLRYMRSHDVKKLIINLYNNKITYFICR